LIVTIDSKEKSRIKPALYFFGENNSVSVADMEYGDYVFEDETTGKTCAFEYKTCSDFITSVNEHKIFNQAIEQANHFEYHFVIIEYTDELRKALSENLWYRKKISFTKAQFYGAIARLNTYTTVLSAHNTQTCFELMEKQARKCFDNKTIHKSLKKVTKNSAMNYLVNCCYGVGTKTAENITGELKLFTLQDLLNLDKPLLLTVNGVGEKTADRILSNIRNDSEEIS
jgi:ERCC4-type nuclease